MEVTINAHEFKNFKLKDLLDFLEKQKLDHNIEYKGVGDNGRGQHKKSNTNNKTIKRTI